MSKASFNSSSGSRNSRTSESAWLLGIFPALVVTTELKAAVFMALSVIAVLALANCVASMLRRTIPGAARRTVLIVIVVVLSVLVEQVLTVVAFEVSMLVSVYVGLIVANSVLMGQVASVALHCGPLRALVKGLWSGIGYGVVLIVVAIVRELTGSGTLWGSRVVPQCWYDAGYMNNNVMLLPPAALLIVACVIWIRRARRKGELKN